MFVQKFRKTKFFKFFTGGVLALLVFSFITMAGSLKGTSGSITGYCIKTPMSIPESPTASADAHYTLTHTFETSMELSGSYYMDQTHTMECTYYLTEVGANTTVSCSATSTGNGAETYSTTFRVIGENGSELNSGSFGRYDNMSVPYQSSGYIFEITLDFTYEYRICTSSGGSVCQSSTLTEYETSKQVVVMQDPILAPQINHTVEEGNSYVPYGHNFGHTDPNIEEYGVGFGDNLKAYWKDGEISSESEFSSPKSLPNCDFYNDEWWIPEQAEYVDDLSDMPNTFTIGFRYETPTGNSPYSFVTVEMKSGVSSTALIIAAVAAVAVIGVVVFLKKQKKSSPKSGASFNGDTSYAVPSGGSSGGGNDKWDDDGDWGDEDKWDDGSGIDDENDWGEGLYHCPNCGNEIAENAKFCNKCGTQIEWE